MIPFENLGYKVGDKFKVIEASYINSYRDGDIVSLMEDDGTSSPFFWNEDKTNYHCIHLYKLKKIAPTTYDWIKWNGGKCPMEKGILVDVEYRDGVIQTNTPAGDCDTNPFHSREAIYWDDRGGYEDIVAYRISKGAEESLSDHPDEGNSDKNILTIVDLISSVAPDVSVGDALNIANILLENGFKQ